MTYGEETMKAKSAIQKGKFLEDHIAAKIREYGLDPKATRSHGSGNTNTEKGDIWTSLMVLGQNAGIEAKNQATLHIPEWWRQTKKLESLGREPILAFKQFGEPLDDTKVVIYLDTLLRLILASQGHTEPTPAEALPENRDLKYKAERARQAIGDLMKALST